MRILDASILATPGRWPESVARKDGPNASPSFATGAPARPAALCVLSVALGAPWANVRAPVARRRGPPGERPLGRLPTAGPGRDRLARRARHAPSRRTTPARGRRQLEHERVARCVDDAGEATRVLGQQLALARVVEACRAYGIAEPTFTEGSGAVTVTFRADVVADAGSKPHAGPSDATLTERQRAILHILEQKPAMALREISAALEGAPSDRRLREELLSLKQRGLVEQSGHGRGSSWSRRRGAE
jgi:hypothetical protein